MSLSPIKIFLIILPIVTLFSACKEDKISIPKPRMYPKVEYPQVAYQALDLAFCPVDFDYPRYATIEKKESFFDQKPADECWFNIHSDTLNYDIHCSYYPLSGKKEDISKLIDDSYKMANKHNQKANYREEYLIKNKQGVTGIQFEIEGPVASPIQFYLTDSTQHFFRASLYFNATVNPDSIAPVLNFVKQDIRFIVESFKWK